VAPRAGNRWPKARTGRHRDNGRPRRQGDANTRITLDLYGHLFPGNEEEAAPLLDAYLAAELARSDEAVRSADGMLTGAPTGAHRFERSLDQGRWQARAQMYSI
jgi:hypothetical protein